MSKEKKESTEIALKKDGSIDYQDVSTKKVLWQMVANGTTEPEFHAFIQFCQSTGLNPVKKEIWCIVTGSGQWRRVQTMVGVNGFYTIANNHPNFEGVEIKYGPDMDIGGSGNKKIIVPTWIEVKAHRSDRKFPQVARAFWREYAQEVLTKSGKLSIWGKMPSIMLAKCAESMALRKLFPTEMNGLYTAEEMPSEYAAHNVNTVVEVVKEEKPLKRDKSASKPKERAQPATTKGWDVENVEGSYLKMPMRLSKSNPDLNLGDKLVSYPWLKAHLAKYNDKYSDVEKVAIQIRLDELAADYAKGEEAKQQAVSVGLDALPDAKPKKRGRPKKVKAEPEVVIPEDGPVTEVAQEGDGFAEFSEVVDDIAETFPGAEIEKVVTIEELRLVVFPGEGYHAAGMTLGEVDPAYTAKFVTKNRTQLEKTESTLAFVDAADTYLRIIAKED